MNAAVPTDSALEVPVSPPIEAPPEPIQNRLLKPHTIVSFAIAVFIVAFLVKRMNIDLGAVWSNIKAANPWYFVAALVLYYLTFAARTLRWR